MINGYTLDFSVTFKEKLVSRYKTFHYSEVVQRLWEAGCVMTKMEREEKIPCYIGYKKTYCKALSLEKNNPFQLSGPWKMKKKQHGNKLDGMHIDAHPLSPGMWPRSWIRWHFVWRSPAM